jgi:hypothetical protein
MYTSIEAMYAAIDMGSTIPVVPIMEIPPTMPRRGLKVFLAMTSPFSQPISRSNPGSGAFFNTSSTAQRIISRGAGLMAGSPTGTRIPGSVTVPTPGPARNRILPVWLGRTTAKITAPSVLSGSSPASLRTSARADPSLNDWTRMTGTIR